MGIQNFRKYFQIASKEAIRWFPGHMSKGMKQMQQKLKQVDCVIEVHDARIPLSGRNTEFHHTLTSGKPSLLVLNKKDLVEKALYPKIIEKIKTESEFVIDNVFFTNCKDQNCKGVKKIIPKAIELIQESNRFNRSEERERSIMIIGVPNVGKSSLVNILRNRHINKKGSSPVGGIAGITRSVLTKVKISEDPLIYLLDTPGVLEPKIRNDEMGMKLALCSCFQDHLVGEDLIADFLLYWMNKNGNFMYVDKMGLDEPSDDILHVLLSGATRSGQFIKLRSIENGDFEWRPDVSTAAKHFIALFRRGDLGPVCLDNVKD